LELKNAELNRIEAIDALLLAHPAAASIAEKDGCPPQHLAADRTDGLEVIEATFKVYPTAESVVDKSGTLPLHLAVVYARLELTDAGPSAHAPGRSEHG